MRLWTIHPQYLDTKGLIALWREGLGALREVRVRLKSRSNYYKHPQLTPFKTVSNPKLYINQYLYDIYLESLSRGYNFDKTKLKCYKSPKHQILISKEQVEFELNHLRNKLITRNSTNFLSTLPNFIDDIKLHPLFKLDKSSNIYWG